MKKELDFDPIESGKIIKDLLKKKNLTNASLSELLCRHEGTISRKMSTVLTTIL